MRTEIIGSVTWVFDENNNRMSVTSSRTQEECEALLKTLWRCSRCSDCSGCSDLRNAWPVEQQTESNPFANIGPVPVIDDIHRKVYEAASQPKSLCMSEWHSCETTHCRAGWVVHLAGELGYALEAATSALFAAQQIYKASGYEISPVRFFDSDAAALEDMRRLADATP